MSKKHRLAGATAIAIFVVAAISQANAEIVSLDCAGPIVGADAPAAFMMPRSFNIWIDMQKSTVMEVFPNPRSGTVTTGSYPAQITALSISWKGTGDESLDRTTGTYSRTFNGGANGNYTYQCTKGTTPLPATQF